MKKYSLEDIFNSNVIKDTKKNYFKEKEIEVLKRPHSYIIKLKKESERKVSRMIILPPEGFTANSLNELSSHPEALTARILIRGGIRPNRNGFSFLKKSIKYIYYTKRNAPLVKNYPYAKLDKNNEFYREEEKSTRVNFLAVKKDGSGFYHNLINLTKEWVLLILEKKMDLQKELKIEKLASKLENNKQKTILRLIERVKTNGDEIFSQDKDIINNLLTMNTEDVVPILINALNLEESGKHEQCTIYSLILKFALKDKNTTLELVKNALKNKEAQEYYLEELIKKISKRQP